ncbi:Sugar transporter [Operophtera brumata]|uniref:Sugar transporter n=1 Tax=Operophtera brumata TaxID=104452 RepID=A0A0L7L6D2_OPEBR|nr:Sugar transporter [Operophtera brumata]
MLYGILPGRLIAGVGIGMATNACRVYITEITLPNMRGLIGALPSLFISAGLGSIIDWKTMCYVYGSFSLIMSVANTFLPDTPYFEILRGSLSQAKINLSKFRAASFDVDSEIKVLSEFRDENDIHRLSLKEQIKAMFKPSSCKPFGISSAYITIVQLAGVNVVIMWAVEMLELAKSSLDAHMGNIMLALTRIVFGIITSVLIYKVRRRKMALVSVISRIVLKVMPRAL